MNTTVRIGSRGSDLALWQARDIAARLSECAGVVTEIVIIQTPGDSDAKMPMTSGVWPTGAFVTSIEQALVDDEIDIGVHSFKDLATVSQPGLKVIATTPRASVHDVLVASGSESAARLNSALEGEGSVSELHIGTSSPRRTAQLLHALGCQNDPIRGNVPTRVAIATQGKLDAVCLAAAGLERLGLNPLHTVVLPIDRFPTAPAQGAIAVQAREGTPTAELGITINHEPTQRCVMAERAFIQKIDAGCHTPVAASAVIEADGTINLHVQLFNENGDLFEEHAKGTDPLSLGLMVGVRALKWTDS